MIATTRTEHNVIRVLDGKTIGRIIARWDDCNNLVVAFRAGRAPASALALFRMDTTPAAFRAARTYRFDPPVS